MDASVTVTSDNDQLQRLLSSVLCQETRALNSSDYSLADVLVVSDAQIIGGGAGGPYSASGPVEWDGSQSNVIVNVWRSTRHKCQRCYRHVAEREGSLCERCHHVMNEMLPHDEQTLLSI